MCRLVLIDGFLEKELLENIVHIFTKVSKFDYIGIISGISKCHRDGWGIYVSTKEREIYYKSIKPLYKDYKVLRNIINEIENCYGTLILHIRNAGRNEPLDLNSVHPFLFQDHFKKYIFAHNGHVNKYKLALLMNIPEKIVKDYCDSYILGYYIFKKLINTNDIESVVNDLVILNITFTSMNFISFLRTESNYLTISFSYINHHRVTTWDRKLYYRMFITELNKTIIIQSSTIYYEFCNLLLEEKTYPLRLNGELVITKDGRIIKKIPEVDYLIST